MTNLLFLIRVAVTTLGIDLGLTNIFMQLGVMLPFSRTHETEADRIGLILMSKACYNPQNSIRFWELMISRGQSEPNQYLSTHPSHSKRIETLKDYMPEAMKVWHDSGCETASGFISSFKSFS
jgi:predicted Zn-dependent protease